MIQPLLSAPYGSTPFGFTLGGRFSLPHVRRDCRTRSRGLRLLFELLPRKGPDRPHRRALARPPVCRRALRVLIHPSVWQRHAAAGLRHPRTSDHPAAGARPHTAGPVDPLVFDLLSKMRAVLGGQPGSQAPTALGQDLDRTRRALGLPGLPIDTHHLVAGWRRHPLHRRQQAGHALGLRLARSARACLVLF